MYRINIGNALVLGLPADLHLKGSEINTALALFYVPYIVFEIPSNIFFKRFKPHVWCKPNECINALIRSFWLMTSTSIRMCDRLWNS